MAGHNELGLQGELTAKSFIEKKGYKVIHENWTYRHAEIDLIAIHHSQLIFIEVKTRTGSRYGNPETFVTKEKRKHLKRAARAFIETSHFYGQCRFDIISLIYKAGKLQEIRHFEDAFF